MKKIFVLIIFISVLLLFIYTCIRQINYYHYIENIISEKNYKIKLLNVMFDNDHNYKINEYINIEEEIKEIISWNYSAEIFLRDTNKKIYIFNIYSNNNIIKLEMTIYNSKYNNDKLIDLQFEDDKISTSFTRIVKNMDIIDKINKKLIDKKSENNDPFYINNIEEKYIGIYLPLEYINAIELTKNHSFSLNLNKERGYHDVLIITEHYIYSDYMFADQYAIKSNEVQKYNFLINNDSEIIICDNNGKLYRKISEYIDDYYDRVSNYIGKIIFKSLNVKQIGLFITGTDVHIPFLNNQIYEIILYEKGIYLWSNLVLKNKNNNEWIYLVIENNKYTFYKAKIEGLNKIKSDEIIYELEIK